MRIYRITNLITGLSYIGQTTVSIEERWKRHCKDPACIRLYNSIQKYGPHKFKIEVIEELSNQATLDEREVFWIEKLNTLSPNGYNLRLGGRTGRHSLETRQRMSKVRLGWTPSEQTRKKMSEGKLGKPSSFKGRTHSDEAKRENGRKHSKQLICLTNGKFYPSAKAAAEDLNLNVNSVSSVASGSRNSVFGYTFKYLK